MNLRIGESWSMHAQATHNWWYPTSCHLTNPQSSEEIDPWSHSWDNPQQCNHLQVSSKGSKTVGLKNIMMQKHTIQEQMWVPSRKAWNPCLELHLGQLPKPCWVPHEEHLLCWARRLQRELDHAQEDQACQTERDELVNGMRNELQHRDILHITLSSPRHGQ